NGIGLWTLQPQPSPLVTWPEANRSPLTSVALTPQDDEASVQAPGALAVGLDGTALHFSPTAGWLTDSLPPRASHLNLLGVAFSGPGRAVAVGQFGVILDWNGGAWSEDPQSISLTQEQLNAVAFESSGNGWAVGTNGT